MNSGLFDENEVIGEAKKQNDYLNSVVGVITFTLALTCVGLPNPQKAAFICLGIVIPLLVVAFEFFPQTITTLRQIVKETQDVHAIEVLKYLEKKYCGFRSLITRNFMYWYGLSFYALVIAFPSFSEWVKG